MERITIHVNNMVLLEIHAGGVTVQVGNERGLLSHEEFDQVKRLPLCELQAPFRLEMSLPQLGQNRVTSHGLVGEPIRGWVGTILD